MKCYRIELNVTGDSKGFRFEILQKALALDIKGFVMRLSLNDFLIEAEGEDEKLAEFLKWFDDGFHYTQIEGGKAEEIPLKNQSTFEMRDNPKLNPPSDPEDEDSDNQLGILKRLRAFFIRSKS